MMRLQLDEQFEGQARTTLQFVVFFAMQVDMRNGRIYNELASCENNFPSYGRDESRTVHIPGPYEDPISGTILPQMKLAS